MASARAVAKGFRVFLAEQHVSELAYEKQALLVRFARIEAQRDGKDAFAAPPASGLTEGVNMADLVAIEKDTLDTQATLLKTQVDLMSSQQPRLQVEINALNAQIATENKQLGLVREQLEQYDRLIKKGLGMQTIQLQLKLQEANHESSVWRLAAEGSRLQRDSVDLILKIQRSRGNLQETGRGRVAGGAPKTQ